MLELKIYPIYKSHLINEKFLFLIFSPLGKMAEYFVAQFCFVKLCLYICITITEQGDAHR